MPLIIVVLTLFAGLIAADADAETDVELELLELAKKFSPVLILTEDTVGKYGSIKVLKPEPVGIMGATSADNIQFDIYAHNLNRQLAKIASASLSDETWFNPKDVKLNEETWDSGKKRIKLLENKFAFFNGLEDLPFTATHGSENMEKGKSYTLKDAHFDFSGTGTEGWDAEYDKIGENENFPNTAYVHIYQRTVDELEDYNPVTVIQYKYFYPYNDWWNNHEGDWQGIDVVVSSSDPNTAQILGVEYRFHGAWLSYYKGNFAAEQTITNSFVFNPKTAVRLIPGPDSIEHTHPVVYVAAGSHASYPVGGAIETWNDLDAIEKKLPEPNEGEVNPSWLVEYWEYMTHTGKVLSTQADYSDTSLWEPYDLQLLPEPYLDYDNNMGLLDTLSWLGARIHWGTPHVGGAGDKSPDKGPYNSNSDDWGGSVSKGWGDLKFFSQGYTGGEKFGVDSFDPFYHDELPYENYHHWAILGEEMWSGTVSLYGDVVVFPGATLKIEAGTVVTFPAGKGNVITDRHQFSAQGNRYYFSEIFVYGTLLSEGTSSKPVVLGGTDPANTTERWGGLRELGSGSVNLGNHTTIRNAKPIKPVFVRTVLTPDPASVAVEWKPTNDPVISGYQTRISTDGITWPEWSDWTEEYDTGNTYRYTETGLREKKDYWRRCCMNHVWGMLVECCFLFSCFFRSAPIGVCPDGSFD